MKLLRTITLALCFHAPFSYANGDDNSFLDRAIPFYFGFALGGLYRAHRGETATGTIIATASFAAIVVGYRNLIAQRNDNS